MPPKPLTSPDPDPIVFEGETPRLPEHLDWTSPNYTGVRRRRRSSSSSGSSGSSGSPSRSSAPSASTLSSTPAAPPSPATSPETNPEASPQTKPESSPEASPETSPEKGSGTGPTSKSSTTKKKKKKKRKQSWTRPRNTVGIPLLVILLLVVGFALYVNAELNGIRRAPFNAEIGGRTGQGTNVLLIGSEAPAHELRVDGRSMIVQLVHLSADGSRAAVIDLPSDLLLPTPGAGAKKPTSETLVSAYMSGGDPAVVTLVQDELDINVDHVSQIGFSGYVKVTDRLGGVELPTPQGVRSFTGAQALGFADATDIDSITAGTRNQQWIRAMFTSAFTPSVLLNPVKVIELLRATTPNLVLDDTFTTSALRGMVLRARRLRPATIRYLTVPYRHYAERAGARVLLPDLAGMRQLGQAVRADNDSGIAIFDN